MPIPTRDQSVAFTGRWPALVMPSLILLTAGTVSAQAPPVELPDRPAVQADPADRRGSWSSGAERNIFGLPAAPLDEPLVTDRPDFTESTDAVPLGRMQLEMGYTFTSDKERPVRTREHTVPELLLRVGLMKDFELRIGWEGYSYTHTRETRREKTEEGRWRTVVERDWDQGAHDLSLGFKLKLFEQDGWRPHFGVIGEMTIPTGSPGASSGDVEPGAILLWGYDVTDRFEIAGNVGMFVLREDRHQFFQTTASLSFAYALTDKLGTYLEYYGLYPDVIREDCAHHLNGGFTYLITDNLQVDWRIGMGLNEQAPDFFTGVGLSMRF